MSLFKYKAMDKSGRTVGNVMEADSEASLSKALSREGLFLVEAAEVKAPPREAKGAKGTPRPDLAAISAAAKAKGAKGPVPLKDVAVFTTQFALMMKASLPALQAISSLTYQQKNPAFLGALLDIQERLKKGEYLSRAFSAHPEAFDAIYINLLSAGEASGQVPAMLNRNAEYLEFQADMKGKVRSALIYPLFVLFAAVSVILFLMIFVLPNFVDIFNQFNAPLPLPTVILLGASRFMREFWYLHLSALALLGWLIRNWLKSPHNREALDFFLLGVPVLGAMIEAVVLTRILRVLEVLLHGQVPILKALEIARAAADHRYYDQLLHRVMKSVSEGRGIALAVEGDPHFPGSLAEMIRHAERTGGLPEVFRLASMHYQKELDGRLRDTFAAMEPVFIGVLSLVVATIAICILMPIMNLGTVVE